MNPRVTTIVVGLIILGLGLFGLVKPLAVLGMIGLSFLNATDAPGALGEIRATYGGIFTVMGIYTLISAMDPALHRGRLLFIGLLWLGACAGRLFGVYVDGNPGLMWWGAAVFELLVGGTLVLVSQSTPAQPVVVQPTTSPALDRAMRDAEGAYEPPPPVAPPA